MNQIAIRLAATLIAFVSVTGTANAIVSVTGTANSIIITVEESNLEVQNSIPFGSAGDHGPFITSVYMDIPAFSVSAGDTIAFDIYSANDVDIIMNLAFATASSNGSNTAGGDGFTQVVSAGNAGTGNNVAGDYDLIFNITNSWSFGGGGLLIGFNAVGVTATDTIWGAPFIGADAAAGTHVGQYYNGSDFGSGVYRASVIPNFQLTIVPEPASYGVLAGALAVLCVARRRKR